MAGRLLVGEEGPSLVNDVHLSTKARNLIRLQETGLPMPTTLIVRGDEGLSQIESAAAEHDYWYLRVTDLKGRTGTLRKIVSGTELSRRSWRSLATDPTEIILQPMLRTSLGGGILTRGSRIYVESAFGGALTLFREGRVRVRLVADDGGLVRVEDRPQDMSWVWSRGAFEEIRCPTGPDAVDVLDELYPVAEASGSALFEWGVVNGQVTFFDMKEVPDHGCYLEMSDARPDVPRHVTSSGAAESCRLTLQFPELRRLPLARRHSTVLVEEGALLSHLATYSIIEPYDCLFR